MTNRTLVQETCSNPGTGSTVTLLGAAPSRRSFASSFSTGQNCFYFLSDGLLSEWGVGTFTAGSPNTLARTTVVGNSAGTTSRLNFTGTTNVYNAVPSEYSYFIGGMGGSSAGGTANDLTATTPISFPTAVPDGAEISCYATAANTGNMRLNVNGEGLLPLLRSDGSEFPAGLIQSGDMIRVVRKGSAWWSLPRASDDVVAILSPSAASSVTALLPARYRNFEVNFSLYFTTDLATLNVRTSTNSGSSYDSGSSDYQTAYSFMNTATTWSISSPASTSSILATVGSDNASTNLVTGTMLFFPGDGTRYPILNTNSGGALDIGAGAFLSNMLSTGARNSATRVNAIRFAPNVGNFTGSISIRGLY